MNLELELSEDRAITTPSTERDEVGFYTNELQCSEQATQSVVNMWNAGKTISEIDDFLLNSVDFTSDDREIIIEGLHILSTK